MGDQKKAAKAHQSEFISQDTAVLFYVMRGITSEENALTIPLIAAEMRAYLGSYSERTLQRTMNKILLIQDWKEERDLNEKKKKCDMARVLYWTYGGRIVKGTGRKYYFEPCLDEASMRMLNGTVISNQFLSEVEKKYLLTRMRLLNMLSDFFESPEEGDKEEKHAAPAPEDEDLTQTVPFPGEGNIYLYNIYWLNHAIRAGRQIKFTYGIYDYSGGMSYHERMEGDSAKEYLVNPYALFWCGGHYYLLATYVNGKQPAYIKEPGTPIHFRVDRIVKLTVEETEREKIPQRLSDFFSVDQEGRKALDEKKYTARFPAMRISSKKNLVNAVIECTPWSLQILVDAFGSFLQVRESRREHEKGELDYNGREQTFLEATIENVEFENIRDFCLANPEYLTPLSPPTLVSAVREKLKAALAKYDGIK